MKRYNFTMMIFCLTIIFIVQCGPEQKPQVPSVLINSAVVTYISGNVEYRSNDSWEEAKLDMKLYPGDVLRTGFLSYCELKIDGLADLRIQEETIIGISSLEKSSDNQKARFDLDIGAVIFKVQSIIGNSEFEVRSKAAVCAIRGTEFGASVALNGDTSFFVKKGVITTFPRLFEMNKLEFEKKSDNFSKLILDIAEKQGVAITQDQEISYSLEETQKSVKILNEKIENLDKEALSQDQELIEMDKIFQTLFTEYRPREMSEKNRRFFLDDEKRENSSSNIEEPQLFSLQISTDPQGAVIFLNKDNLGLSPVSALKEAGQHMLFIEKIGYEPYETAINLKPDGLKLTIPLKIADLQIITSQEIIENFQGPNIYYSQNKVASADSVRDNYEMNYHESFWIRILNGRLKSITFKGDSGIDFYNGKLRFGATLPELLALLGEPLDISDTENHREYIYDELNVYVVDEKVQDILVKKFGPLLTHGSYSPQDWVIDFSLKLDAMVRDKGLTLQGDEL
ncbi:MAG: PEGA domain-containing protein [Spirochaetales bacterium]|nr:PEGA domain-containing protein [Spirochaetales bacterium]